MLHSPLLQHVWPYFRETVFSFIAVNIFFVLFVSLGSEFLWGGQSHSLYFVCPSRAHSWRLMNVYSIVLLEPSTLFRIVLTSVVNASCILRPIVGSRHALFHFFILPPMLCIDLSVIQISNCCINDKGFPRSSVWRGEIFQEGQFTLVLGQGNLLTAGVHFLDAYYTHWGGLSQDVSVPDLPQAHDSGSLGMGVGKIAFAKQVKTPGWYVCIDMIENHCCTSEVSKPVLSKVR